MPAPPGNLRQPSFETAAPAEQGEHTIRNYPRRTPTRVLHMAFKIPYVYDFITELCRQQAEVIQNHDNENVRNIGQGEVQHRKYKRPKLGGGQAYDRSSV
jgi:hypothetical protein